MAKNIGIVLAGGIGQRFGGGRPKQYFPILGKEMIAYSIELFRAARTIDDFVVCAVRDLFSILSSRFQVPGLIEPLPDVAGRTAMDGGIALTPYIYVGQLTLFNLQRALLHG